MAIHPAAIVHPGAKIGRNVEIGPFAIVDEHVSLGDETVVMAHAVVTGYTEIGRRNEIHYGAIVGHIPQDKKFAGKRSYVRIGDGNIIREYAQIHRGSDPEAETVIGNENLIMGGVHIAHDCRLHDRAILSNDAKLAGYVTVEDQAVISGNVVVHQFSRIGRLAMVGGNSRVAKDVPPFTMVEGNSAVRGLNVVGMRRAQIPLETRQAIKKAYKMIFDPEIASMEDALTRIEGEDGASAEVGHVLRFIRESKRGICWERRRGAGRPLDRDRVSTAAGAAAEDVSE